MTFNVNEVYGAPVSYANYQALGMSPMMGMYGTSPYGMGMMPQAPLITHQSQLDTYQSGKKDDSMLKIGVIGTFAVATAAILTRGKLTGKAGNFFGKISKVFGKKQPTVATTANSATSKTAATATNATTAANSTASTATTSGATAQTATTATPARTISEKDLNKAAKEAREYSAKYNSSTSEPGAKVGFGQRIKNTFGKIFGKKSKSDIDTAAQDARNYRAKYGQETAPAVETKAATNSEKMTKAEQKVADNARRMAEKNPQVSTEGNPIVAPQKTRSAKVEDNARRMAEKNPQVSSEGNPIVGYQSIEGLKAEKAAADKAYSERVNAFYARPKTKTYVAPKTPRHWEITSAQEQVRKAAQNTSKVAQNEVKATTQSAVSSSKITKAEQDAYKKEFGYQAPTAEEKIAIKKNNAQANKAKAEANQIQNHAKLGSLTGSQRSRNNG